MLPMSRSDGPGRMPGWPDVRALASHAESAGLDSVWVCDHLLSEPPGERPEGVLEGWTVLAALAASTRRVTLGTLDIVGRLLDGAVVDSARFHRLRARLAAMTRALAAAGREPDSRRVTVGMSVETGRPTNWPAPSTDTPRSASTT